MKPADVLCPECDAAPGLRCKKARGGVMDGYHAGRLQAAARLAPSLFGEDAITLPPDAVRILPAGDPDDEEKKGFRRKR